MEPENKNSWVLGIKQDISNHRKKKFAWFILVLLSFLCFYFSKNISNFTGISSDNIGSISFLVFLFSILFFIMYDYKPDYLAYYFYQIGNELINFDDESHYLKRNQKYLKNCVNQIKRLRGEDRGYFSDDIIDFYNNLNQIVLQLNHLFTKGEVNETFVNNQISISSKLIELANLIHKNYSNLTPRHLKLTNEILNLLKDTPSKPFEFHKLFAGKIKQKWYKQSFELKIIFIILIAFIGIFFALLNFMTWFGLERDSCVTTAVLGSIMIIGILLSLINPPTNYRRVK